MIATVISYAKHDRERLRIMSPHRCGGRGDGVMVRGISHAARERGRYLLVPQMSCATGYDYQSGTVLPTWNARCLTCRPAPVTLQFTDIEGSTALGEQYPQAMRKALL